MILNDWRNFFAIIKLFWISQPLPSFFHFFWILEPDGVKRFLLGRQLIVVPLGFLVAQITSFDRYPAYNFSQAFYFFTISLGLPGQGTILFYCSHFLILCTFYLLSFFVYLFIIIFLIFCVLFGLLLSVNIHFADNFFINVIS